MTTYLYTLMIIIIMNILDVTLVAFKNEILNGNMFRWEKQRNVKLTFTHIQAEHRRLLAWSPLDTEESFTCMPDNFPIQQKDRLFSWGNLFKKNNLAYCWMGKLSGKPINPLYLKICWRWKILQNVVHICNIRFASILVTSLTKILLHKSNNN